MKIRFFKFYALIFLLLVSDMAFASTTGSLPFNSTINNFSTSFTGWIFSALVVLWIATCLMLAFGEWGEGIKRIINIIFWASLACGGAAGAMMIFGGTGAVF